ncbi:MAG: uroporphyrinogen-III C-methyltransferase [Candidatus Competibacter denitrificans]|jgi:uncharacterized protein HemX|uniref:Uroporphyrinogen-III C-methyltransferase n=1 Tax=Candidatus Competibacter denitrificans Run_A_D11 TaxID=1400863 RepID=W6M6V9_9GAMM|nr:uroporphyrinogen-III C-methyltransferase [Candidatus Competibacter denitrificans]CDI03636.1 hypothetical protein BN873_610033 [Candidatus Competibacter denitrificans Run_A_D11]HAS85262.1 hypothetical protein [Candidatus Competibacteraceae bacterium]HRC69264.1 uroporphyrinogen-III C-methyltransferase [Candidatus Competibacter denitrificans]
MTETTSDNVTTKAAPIAAATTAPPTRTATSPPPKGGRGLASFALLLALGAFGGSGYLWYLWQQERASHPARLEAAVKQATAQINPELQALKTQLQQVQGLKTTLDQARAESQDLKGQALGLAGDLQPLKNAMELQKGENEVLKGEIKLLRENSDIQKAEAQKQRQALEAQVQAQQTQLAKVDDQLKNARLADTGLAESLETLRTLATKGGDINAFPLAEVDYLLRLADSKLKLERNVPTARLALETAQQRLKAVDESAMAPLQTMLGEAISSLRGAKLPDFSGLAHKLMEMGVQVAKLPIKIDSGVPDIKDRVKPSANAAISPDTAGLPWWERAGEAVWQQFKDIVVIRRVRSEAPPLVAMEEEFFLRQNLMLELESMRAALLRSDAQTYQDSAELANKWLNTYFDTRDSRVSTLLAELKAVREVEFNVYLPDLTGIQQAFNEVLSRRQPIRAAREAATVSQPALGREGRP